MQRFNNFSSIWQGLRKGASGAIRARMSSRASEEAVYETAITTLNQYQLRPPLTQGLCLTPKDKTRRWLELLGIDLLQPSTPKVIHIAGSKGKGTTCYYCNHLLNEIRTAAGTPQKIGCYTSPHHLDVRDRFLINNQRISKLLFSNYLVELDDKLRSLTSSDLDTPTLPLYPGFLALLAIYIFVKESIEVLVLETGVGGETDSTNVFPHPAATGITTIGLDHIQALGDTVEKIAWHKAGIFKADSPAFATLQSQAVLDIFRARGREKQIRGSLHVVADQLPQGLKVAPDRPYQRLNASLAIALVSASLGSNPSLTLTPSIVNSLQNVSLPGRSQIFWAHDTQWFVSVAHSELSLEETALWFRDSIQLSRKPRVLIFNYTIKHQSPRDPQSLLQTIRDASAPFNSVIFCTNQIAKGEEKLDLVDLRVNNAERSALTAQKANAKIWRQLEALGQVYVVHTISDAVALVRKEYAGSNVLVAGSNALASGIIYTLGTVAGHRRPKEGIDAAQ